MIKWIATTEKSPWVEQTAPDFSVGSGMPDVFIDTKRTAQSIEGFGGSFNEYGWTSLSLLSQQDRDAVMRDIFAPGVGLNFSLCRMPVASNDFSEDFYSYDEVDGDFELEHFSIENDEKNLIPFIREAKKYQPKLAIWASPWSPPTWMKRNGHYAGAKPNPAFNTGSATNGLRDDQVQVEGTDNFKLEEPYLAAYAKYFGKFIDEYAARDIKISMVMPQNEWNSAQVFPSCVWTPQGLAKFVAHLGPEMEKRGVEVFLGTLERPDEQQALIPINDPITGKYIKGVGVQWAGKGATPFIHRAKPELRIYQSEQQCGDGKNDWRFARHVWNLMKFYFDNGATGYMYWNMSLEEGGVSRWGWSQNSLVVVDPETKSYRFSHEYYMMKHVSHFVQPGAKVVETFSWNGYEQQFAFKNPDGSLVVVMQNAGTDEMDVNLVIDGKLLKVLLPADSVNTFVLN
ncbi:MAG: hypothetical protein RL612_281 [Actinomycetota bacterium]